MRARRFSEIRPSAELVGGVLSAAAVLWVFLVAVWGVNATFPEGHFASEANIGIAGLQMNRWGILYPAFPLTDHPPPASTYYMHHPLGIFWMAGLLIKIFGAHNWVLRLPAIVYVTLTTYFCARTARPV